MTVGTSPPTPERTALSLLNYRGLASLDDLDDCGFRTAIASLETVHREFADAEPFAREYPWPRRPLYAGTRIWEYPYVYRLLAAQRREAGNKPLKIGDFGSGGTFFPFALARLDCAVTAIDTDASARVTIENAIRSVDMGAGSVAFCLSEPNRIPLPDASFDVLYSISVVEHIEEPEGILSELRRLLRPGGALVLTVDIDLTGEAQLGPSEHTRFLHAIEERFTLTGQERFVHPRRVLTCRNSPYPAPSPAVVSAWSRRQRAKNALYRASLGGWKRMEPGRSQPDHVAVYALTARRDAPGQSADV